MQLPEDVITSGQQTNASALKHRFRKWLYIYSQGTSSTSKHGATCLLHNWRPWQASGILQDAIANTAQFKSGRSTIHLAGEEVLVLSECVDCNQSTLHMKPRYHPITIRIRRNTPLVHSQHASLHCGIRSEYQGAKPERGTDRPGTGPA